MKIGDKETKKILNGAVWLGLSAIILKVIGLIYKVPISYLLGDEGMGYFNSAYTVYTLFYIIGSAGIPKAVSILCAKATPSEAKSIFLVMFKIYIMLGIVLSLILIAFSGPLAVLISSKSSAYSIFAIAPSVMFVCASGVLRGYLNGKTRFVPIAISELISGMCKLFLGLALAFLAIKAGFGLPVVCAFSILGITIGSFFGFIYLYIYYIKESKTIKREYIQKNRIITEVFKIGLPIAFAAALSSLVNIIYLSLIMNKLSNAGYSESVSTVIYGNYTTLAVPMFNVVTNLLNMITLAALPVITKSFSERKYDELKTSFSSSVNLSMFIAIPSFFLFMFFPYEILSLIFEIGSATVGAAFLASLAPAVIFYSILISVNTALEGTGKIKVAVISLIVGAAVKLLLSILLIGNDIFGALGAPISTSVSYFVSGIFSISQLKKDRNLRINILKLSQKPLVISVISLIVTILVKYLLNSGFSTRVNSLLILSVYGIIYIIFSFFSTIIKKQKLILSAKCTKNKVYDY